MQEQTLDEAAQLERIRGWLASQGEVGSWLLAQIDDAIDTGIELVVTQEEEIDSSEEEDLFGGHAPARRRRTRLSPSPKSIGIASRQPDDPVESLRIHLRVLRAYVVELPQCVHSTRTQLREDFGIVQASIILPGPMSAGALAREQTAVHLEEMLTTDWEAVAKFIDDALAALDI